MRLKLLFICFSVVLFSCKKDPVEPTPSGNGIPPDYSQLEGVFHFEITDDLLYDQSQSRNYDFVQTVYVTGDTLHLGSGTPFFIISSDTQTVFTYSYANTFYSETATLVYSNNCQDIQYDYYSTSLSFGPDYDESYTGSKTTLLPTSGYPHPYSNEIESNYVMEVTKKDFSTGLDTSYVDTLAVTLGNSMTFNIDNSNWDMPVGHTYYDYRYETSGTNETVNLEKWYRTPDDSLYIEKLTYIENWFTPPDTIQTIFYGKKL